MMKPLCPPVASKAGFRVGLTSKSAVLTTLLPAERMSQNETVTLRTDACIAEGGTVGTLSLSISSVSESKFSFDAIA